MSETDEERAVRWREQFGLNQAAELIRDWKNKTPDQREPVFSGLLRLPFGQLGDLLIELKEIKGNQKDYWPLNYGNRVASHYFQLKTSELAKQSARHATYSVGIAVAALVFTGLAATVPIFNETVLTIPAQSINVKLNLDDRAFELALPAELLEQINAVMPIPDELE